MPSDTEFIDTNLVTQSLQKVARGAGIVFVGSIASIILAFVSRILIAKHYTEEEYGIFSLGYAILFISVMVGTLGLQEGTARQIAYYKGKEKNEVIWNIIFYSLLFGMVAGTFLFVFLFSFSNIISVKIFHLLRFSYYLQMFSVSIPFYVWLFIITAIFRGFGSVKEKVIFNDLLRNALFLIFLSYIVFENFAFRWVVISFSASIIVSLLIFSLYFIFKIKIILAKSSIKKYDFGIGKELLIFSLPLLLVTILNQVMSWTDTLMLGYFKTATVVGLYNAALPLGQFISLALGSILFIYMPVISELYAKNKLYEIKRSYTILTKWLSAATLPLVLIFLFFPRTTLSFLFGCKYVLAATPLQILVLGFFLNNLLGPNGATLLAMGKTKFLMCVTFAAAVINVALNIILIPSYGMNGAAIATVVAIVSINIVRSIKLYSISGIHSLEKNIVKPILLSVVLVLIIYFIAKNILVVTFWMLPILFFIFLILYAFFLVITKSLDREDLEMLLTIEKKTGIDLSLMKKIMKKFE